MDLALANPTDFDLPLDLHVDPRSGLVINHGTSLLFLGTLYSLPVPAPTPQMRILALCPTPERRYSLYARLLALFSPSDPLAVPERIVWNNWLVESLELARILPDAPGGLVRSVGSHWMWHGKAPRGGAMPSVNIWGMHDVSIHRVLRIWASPVDPIPDNRNPTRIPHLCAERLCVHPSHMWVKPTNPPLPVQGYQGQKKLTGLPAKQVKWYTQPETGIAYCKPHDHPIQQPRTRPDGTLPGFVHCPRCYLLRKAAMYDPQSHRPPADMSDMEQDIYNMLPEWREPLPGI